jgi:hypothetical protein
MAKIMIALTEQDQPSGIASRRCRLRDATLSLSLPFPRHGPSPIPIDDADPFRRLERHGATLRRSTDPQRCASRPARKYRTSSFVSPFVRTERHLGVPNWFVGEARGLRGTGSFDAAEEESTPALEVLEGRCVHLARSEGPCEHRRCISCLGQLCGECGCPERRCLPHQVRGFLGAGEEAVFPGVLKVAAETAGAAGE